MTTNTIITTEINIKQTTSKSSAANSNVQLAKNITQEKKDLKRKDAIQATAEWNSLLIWARKQRGPYYDPTTRMYHVNRNSDKYFSGYTEQDAEAEGDAIPSGQKNIPNNGFIIKPTHTPVDKEIVNHGNHISPARIGTPSGRRPGRPRKSEISKLN
ncbi:hypothetical protein Glove_18g57 [Diversispora epigaea]|uniref:Uncharacterized protein n=1 Tax=Diversispora epigaea TaxID=1348612 RepID=A0A397JXI6_9GLOM|nr:hypothetical protein Glove_18g57 [Diversispora epigaea]